MKVTDLTIGTALNLVKNLKYGNSLSKFATIIDELAWSFNWPWKSDNIFVCEEDLPLMELFTHAIKINQGSRQEDGLVRLRIRLKNKLPAEPLVTDYIYVVERSLLIQRHDAPAWGVSYRIFFSHPDNTNPEEIQRMHQARVYDILPLPAQL